MNNIYVSATNLKRDISKILNDVSFGDKTVVIERHGKTIAKIVPIHADEIKNDTDTLLSKYFGAMPDFPDVKKGRKFRKKDIFL